MLREPSPIRSTVCRYAARRGWKFSHAEIRTSQALSVVKKIGGQGWKFSLCKSVDVVGYLRSGNFSGTMEVPSTEIWKNRSGAIADWIEVVFVLATENIDSDVAYQALPLSS